MDPVIRQRLGSSFERDSQAYADHRPTYPAAAARWLVGDPARDVLDLGAGTGSLTALVVAMGHRVVAAEPGSSMLGALVSRGLGVPVVQSRAESLPFRSASFDVVTVATAFHWFDVPRALPQIAAALRPGGRLALAWNTRVESAGWPGRLGDLLRAVQPGGLPGDWGTGSVDQVVQSPLFTGVEHADFGFTQRLDRDELTGLVGSRSYVICLEPDRRRRLLDDVGQLFDDAVDTGSDSVDTGSDSVDTGPTVELPYVTQCWRFARPCSR